MPKLKRHLRIVKSAGATPLQGVCTYCNLVFEAIRDEKGFASDKSEVRERFEKHKCDPQDVTQNVARIVREATEDY